MPLGYHYVDGLHGYIYLLRLPNLVYTLFNSILWRSGGAGAKAGARPRPRYRYRIFYTPFKSYSPISVLPISNIVIIHAMSTVPPPPSLPPSLRLSESKSPSGGPSRGGREAFYCRNENRLWKEPPEENPKGKKKSKENKRLSIIYLIRAFNYNQSSLYKSPVSLTTKSEFYL